MVDRFGEETGAIPHDESDDAEELFEFLYSKRTWVTLTARAATGEKLPKGIHLEEQSWIGFIDSAMRQQRFGSLKFDLGLLLITVEGILNNHIRPKEDIQ